jgi:hypothetical protein
VTASSSARSSLSPLPKHLNRFVTLLEKVFKLTGTHVSRRSSISWRRQTFRATKHQQNDRKRYKKNSSVKTVAEQCISLQTPLGSVVEILTDNGSELCKQGKGLYFQCYHRFRGRPNKYFICPCSILWLTASVV